MILKNSNILFLCITLFSFTSKTTALSPEIPFDTICDDCWHTAEFIFITTPEKELNSRFNQAAHVGLYAAGTIPGIIWLNKNNTIENVKNYLNGNERYPNEKLLIDGVVSFLLSILPGEILSQIIKHIARKKIYFKHFKNFILTWPSTKERIPETFHKIFDYIHEEYSKSKSDNHLKKLAKATIPKVQEAIYEQFPVKYHDKQANKFSVLSFIKRSLITFGLASLTALLINEKDTISEKDVTVPIDVPKKDPILDDQEEEKDHLNEGDNENQEPSDTTNQGEQNPGQKTLENEFEDLLEKFG